VQPPYRLRGRNREVRLSENEDADVDEEDDEEEKDVSSFEDVAKSLAVRCCVGLS
jgi:hypothetical protein